MSEKDNFQPERLFVHCVTSGSYSDYRVICVCDSRERAQSVAKAMQNDPDGYRHDAEVETLPLVDYEPEKVPIYHMTVTIWDEGITNGFRDWTTYEWPFDTWDSLDRFNWRWVRAPAHHNKGGRLDINGTDREAVRHIFSDKRAQLIVEDALRMKKEVKGRG